MTDRIVVLFRQDFFQLLLESREQIGFVAAAHNLALAEDEPCALSTCDAEIGLLCFAGTVDDAAHDSDLEGTLDVLAEGFDRLSEARQIDLRASAGWAADDVDASFLEPEAFENADGYRDLVGRIACQADADRIADALRQMPTEDLIVPLRTVPASVTPRCSG